MNHHHHHHFKDTTFGAGRRSHMVHFASNPVSQYAICINDENNIGQYWYTDDDLSSFKLERSSIVRAYRQSTGGAAKQQEGHPACHHEQPQDDHHHHHQDTTNKYLCIRGFEDYLSQESLYAKKRNIRHVVETVLAEQARQRVTGEQDESRLSLISQLTTYPSVKKAEQVGESDAQEAFRVYAEYVQMINLIKQQQQKPEQQEHHHQQQQQSTNHAVTAARTA